MTSGLSQLSSSTIYTVGNTPVVQLQKVIPDNSAAVLVKLEYFNPTGSYKDRMALAMIEEAEMRGDLRPGMTVVEYTGGSTGSSLAWVCAAKWYAFKVAQADNTYFTDQFNNSDSIRGYTQIGIELLQQVDRPIDAYCGGVGTAGMLMGVARAFRQAKVQTRMIALEPATSAVISTGKAGTHDVEGIGARFVPPLLDQEYYDEIRTIGEADAREMARRLAREEGIFTGISSGLNVVGAIQLTLELGTGHTVATVAVDSGLKYLNGDLYAE